MVGLENPGISSNLSSNRTSHVNIWESRCFNLVASCRKFPYRGSCVYARDDNFTNRLSIRFHGSNVFFLPSLLIVPFFGNLFPDTISSRLQNPIPSSKERLVSSKLGKSLFQKRFHKENAKDDHSSRSNIHVFLFYSIPYSSFRRNSRKVHSDRDDCVFTRMKICSDARRVIAV